MVIKINKQLRDEVSNKLFFVKEIKDRVRVGLVEAKEITDCLDGDRSYVIPASFTRENRIELYNVLAEAGLEPEWCKDEDETDEEDENPDKLGTYIDATEMGIIVTVRIRVDKEISGQLKNVLHDAGMSSALEMESKESEDLSVISVSNNFGSGVNIRCITNYVADILHFRDSVNIEYTLRKIEYALKKAINEFGIKRTMEEYKKTL